MYRKLHNVCLQSAFVHFDQIAEVYVDFVANFIGLCVEFALWTDTKLNEKKRKTSIHNN